MVCVGGSCLPGCLIDGRPLLSRARNPSDRGQCCNPALDANAWTDWFQPGGSYAVPGITSVWVVDLNGDNQPDIVEAHGFSGFGVWLNEGGKFALQEEYGADYYLQLQGRDLHRSRTSDLIFQARFLPFLMVNRGDGTFDDAIKLFDGGTDTLAVAVDPVVGDFDGDGIPDIAALIPANPEPNPGDAGIVVYMGLADGGFALPVGYPLGGVVACCDSIPAMLTGDFRGNGSKDLVIQGVYLDPQVLLGYGDGGFAPPVPCPFSEYDYATGVRWFLVGDFDGDGRDDLAAVTIGLESAPEPIASLEVRSGSSDGSFGPSRIYPMVRDPDQVLATLTYRDLDGDGPAEMIGFFGAWQDDAQNALRIYWQLPDGGFSSPTQLFSEKRGVYWEYGDQLNVADLDGDGAPDIVIQSGPGFEVFLNACL
jgi:hypothetical protein